VTGQELKLINCVHPDFTDSLEDWILWRDVFKSGRKFVKDYLEPFSLRENPQQFETRKKLTPPPAFAKSAIMEIVNNIFQRMPDITRTDGTKSYMECLDGKNGGVDLIGSSMNYFIGMKILPELLTMRRVGVYVDMPAADGATLLDVRARNIRPYLYRYYAEEIVNWHLDMTDSINEFTSILLKEDYLVIDPKFNMPKGQDTRYRHLFIGADGFVHVRYYNNASEMINEYGQKDDSAEVVLKINRIPFVMFEIPHSLLEDAAMYQVALLNMNSSDINYCIYSNFPFYTEQQDDRAITPYTRPTQGGGVGGEGTEQGVNDGQNKNIQVGPMAGRGYPLTADRPDFIAPPTEPLMASMTKQDKLELAIRKLINLSVIQLGQVQASAESKMMDNSGLEAGLSAIGIECERGERAIADFWAMYESSDQAATVHYPMRYSIKSDKERQDEAESAAKICPQFPSQTMRKEIMKSAARTLMGSKVSKDKMLKIEKEIDAAEIIVTDPETVINEVTAGILDKKNAAKALLLPDDAVDQANKEHADRLAVISAHQGKNFGDQARGNPDGSADSNAGKQEKVAASGSDTKPVAQDQTRGKGK
jgi:hypothetical protein